MSRSPCREPSGSPSLPGRGSGAVTNLLNNTRMFPGGYSYQYLAPDATGSFALTGTRYFYPLGTRSVLVMLDLTP